MPATPYLLTFERIGSPEEGYITTTQYADKVPFAIRRVFWTHGTPPEVVRGRHAHYHTEQVLVAVQGQIRVQVENGIGAKIPFALDHTQQGLYLPPMHWANIYFEAGAVLLCFASTDYQEEDYIRSYDTFLREVQHHGV